VYLEISEKARFIRENRKHHQKAEHGFQYCVLHNGQLTNPFTTVPGVRQGCLLSAIIFLIVLGEVLKRSLDGRRRGFEWKLTEHLGDLDYAGDIVHLSHNFREI
jgi:hypothetical protein